MVEPFFFEGTFVFYRGNKSLPETCVWGAFSFIEKSLTGQCAYRLVTERMILKHCVPHADRFLPKALMGLVVGF